MKKYFKLLSIVFFIIIFHNSCIYGQVARSLGFKDVKEMKSGSTYFILHEDQDTLNEIIKTTIEKYWTFNEIKFEYFKNLSSLEKEKKAYMIGIGDGSITMGQRGFNDPAVKSGRLGTSPGSTTSFSGLFISKRLKESTFQRVGLWEGGIFTRNKMDVIQFFPLYLKMLNSMLLKIEENKAKNFTAKTAEKIYSKKKVDFGSQTIFILNEHLPYTKYSMHLTKISGIKELYKGDIKIVGRDELYNAIKNEDDVIFLHFYRELKFNMCSAISCKTGEVVALSSQKTPRHWKFFERLLISLNP